MSDLPSFECEYLSRIVESLRKRRKAISHQTSKLNVQKVIEVSRDAALRSKMEKLEIVLQGFASKRDAVLRIFIWQDRWAFVDARLAGTGKRGWNWEWTCEGTLLGSVSGRQIVEALEEAVALASSMNADQVAKFDQVWKHMFYSKPKLIT
jgi:hypothetical protein